MRRGLDIPDFDQYDLAVHCLWGCEEVASRRGSVDMAKGDEEKRQAKRTKILRPF